ncbi:MAG: hypothetical protein IIY43_07440 [Oscillospiraceae bacterium]|nr:hypothetical protein [Oscillospiraceae bacterium]
MADTNMNDQNMFLDWNDEIENDGQEFVTLEEGDYIFEVTGFERGRFPGGPKIPACNKAALTLQVKTPAGLAVIKTDLLLYKTMEWKLSSFFRCIGQKKHGERLQMNWNKVVGSRGRAHFKPRTYTNSSGEERQVNDVDRFYDWEEEYFPAEGAKFTELSGDDELPFE